MDIGGQTGTTDEDGEFIIEDVPTGKWPVTVIDKDGNVIGIGEITSIPTAPAIAGAYYKYDGQYRTSLPLANTPYERKKKGE